MIVAQWLSSLEMNMAPQVQTLSEGLCIAHSANTIGKRYASNYSLSDNR